MNVKMIWFGVLLLGSGAAVAAEDTLEQARRCASQADSLQRLVCYDRLFGADAPAPAALPPVAAPPAARPSAPPPVVAAPPVAAQSSPAPAAAPAAAPAQDFGADQLRRAPSETARDETPRTLTATVSSLRETRTSVFRVTLDNGQVWQQMDMDSLFHLQSGDVVEISRGKLGGYRMARQSRGGSGWVRVSRVK